MRNMCVYSQFFSRLIFYETQAAGRTRCDRREGKGKRGKVGGSGSECSVKS